MYRARGVKLYKHRQSTYNVTLRRGRVTTVAMEKQYSECESLALVIHHAKRMHRIISSSVACPAVPHFPTLPHKLYDFVKKKIY